MKEDLLHLGRCQRQLVKEEGAAVCALEEAHTIAVRSGERATCVAGEMRDLEVLRDRGARLLDKVARALREHVNVAGYHALPRAPRAEDQQRIADPGIPHAVGDHLLDGARGAKHQPQLLSHSERRDSGSPTGVGRQYTRATRLRKGSTKASTNLQKHKARRGKK